MRRGSGGTHFRSPNERSTGPIHASSKFRALQRKMCEQGRAARKRAVRFREAREPPSRAAPARARADCITKQPYATGRSPAPLPISVTVGASIARAGTRDAGNDPPYAIRAAQSAPRKPRGSSSPVRSARRVGRSAPRVPAASTPPWDLPARVPLSLPPPASPTPSLASRQTPPLTPSSTRDKRLDWDGSRARGTAPSRAIRVSGRPKIKERFCIFRDGSIPPPGGGLFADSLSVATAAGQSARRPAPGASLSAVAARAPDHSDHER